MPDWDALDSSWIRQSHHSRYAFPYMALPLDAVRTTNQGNAPILRQFCAVGHVRLSDPQITRPNRKVTSGSPKIAEVIMSSRVTNGLVPITSTATCASSD
ncbi:uncharacterized protein TrAFT101_006756 [Trichoderma asperellum]|uniref:uncharacterized protein n=1 Tax=Trichoderma asperellum TaxID=101201 RepID=UPI00332C1B4E|nr:hypothetical protein TrAFT101_006756 [Trichoderma asperellum]